MWKIIKTQFTKLPAMVQLVIGVALLALVLWIGYGGYNYLSYKIPTMIDNAKDAQLQKKNQEIEELKVANQKQIDVYAADNIKLAAERDSLIAERKAINEALANDGKIIKSEQEKINEAHKKYEETKNSCATIADPDAYVQCVCNKLAVACS